MSGVGQKQNQTRTRTRSKNVGAGLLAKVVNDDAGILNERGALRFFASKPPHKAALLLIWLLILICLPHSARGRTQVLRSG
ncbi:hypothetical protein CEC48_26245 [Pseudomonas sp. K2I15]|nr:hypothetical protein CEC48_26245 [Pseudomonas sp. K2I15]